MESLRTNNEEHTLQNAAIILKERLGDLYYLFVTTLNTLADVKAEGSFSSKSIDPEKQQAAFIARKLDTETLEELNDRLVKRRDIFLNEKNYYAKRNDSAKVAEMENLAKLFDFKITLRNGECAIEE
jgi:hypothetical protein